MIEPINNNLILLITCNLASQKKHINLNNAMKKNYLLLAISFLTTTTQAQWIQKGADIDGEEAQEYSGRSVSMSSDGNTLAVGAPYNDGIASNSGHVRIYEWSGAAWTQKGADIDGEAADDISGWSLSLSSDGNTVAIGAEENDGSATSAGHVRVYEWSGTAWTQKGADIDGEAAFDFSSRSVSMSADGNTLAIGASGNDGTATWAGHARVYEWSGTAWTQKGADIDGEAANDQSGHSVSMSSDGNTVAIGAPYNDGAAGNAGHVRVYEWSGTAWTQKGADINGEATNDQSGSSVSLSSDGNTVAIGAPFNGGAGAEAGQTRVYQWSGTSWAQKGTDIDGETADDQSGYAVSISSDGNTVAIGAPYSDETATDAGHVRVYKWSGSAWAQKGADIDGEGADDQSGYAVTISSDGHSVAIGAIYNDGTGIWAGHVRAYYFSTVGIIENDFGNVLALYPNPTSGNISLDLGFICESAILTLTDINGKLICSNTYNNRQLLDMRLKEPAGVYLLIVESEEKKAVIRLVKE